MTKQIPCPFCKAINNVIVYNDYSLRPIYCNKCKKGYLFPSSRPVEINEKEQSSIYKKTKKLVLKLISKFKYKKRHSNVVVKRTKNVKYQGRYPERIVPISKEKYKNIKNTIGKKQDFFIKEEKKVMSILRQYLEIKNDKIIELKDYNEKTGRKYDGVYSFIFNNKQFYVITPIAQEIPDIYFIFGDNVEEKNFIDYKKLKIAECCL